MIRRAIAGVLAVVTVTMSAAGAADDAAQKKLVADVTAAVDAKYQKKLDELSLELARRRSVAVVDLQAVAKALGRDVLIAQLIQQNNNNLLGQLKVAEVDLNSVWEAEKTKAGPLDKLDDPHKQELAGKYKDLQGKLRGSLNQADQFSKTYQSQLINSFRDEVRPAAQRIANARGAGIVLVTAEPVLSFDPAMDITGDVITVLRSAQSKMSVPPMAAPAKGAGSADAKAAPAAPATDAKK